MASSGWWRTLDPGFLDQSRNRDASVTSYLFPLKLFLSQYSARDIEPVFIISGLQYSRSLPMGSPEHQYLRQSAWEAYYRDDLDTASRMFMNSGLCIPSFSFRFMTYVMSVQAAFLLKT